MTSCTELPDREEVVESQVAVSNGISLNGISLNGISLNGISLNGISLNGISLNGISLNGISLNGISLNGPLLAVTAATTVGSKWTARLSDGSTLALRIDSASVGDGANSDVGLYGVSYQTTTGWQPLCGRDAAGAPVLAIATAGVWDAATGGWTASATEFSFACRGTSVAKCVELGYKPWKRLESYMVACTRLLRADFCGDGVPHTVDGNLVNLYDQIGVQSDTEDWPMEAEWGPDGAVCISQARITRWSELGIAVPPCAPRKASGSCGNFKSGLIADEYLDRTTAAAPAATTTKSK